MRSVLGIGLVAALLCACQADEPSAGAVPTTPRALAWLAAEYLGDPASATRDQDAAEEFGCDGQAGRDLDGCGETEDGVIMWQLEEPEEDPGVTYVVVPRGDSEVLMFTSGPSITGDPRDLDLPVSVATMFELALDPRVDVTTTQEAVDGGRDLDFWE